MFCGCGVGSYRGKQSVGSTGDTCACAKSNAYTTASSNTCAASYSSTHTYPDSDCNPHTNTGA